MSVQMMSMEDFLNKGEKVFEGEKLCSWRKLVCSYISDETPEIKFKYDMLLAIIDTVELLSKEEQISKAQKIFCKRIAQLPSKYKNKAKYILTYYHENGNQII